MKMTWFRVNLLAAFGSVVIYSVMDRPSQAADVPEDLQRYQQSADVQRAMAAAAEEGEKSITPDCAQMSFKSTGQIAVLKPVKFETGKPVAGLWAERIVVTGCDGERLQNIYSIVAQNGELKRIAMAPGTTITDPFLQKDAFRYAVVAVGAREKSCNDMKLTNTRFDAKTGPSSASTPSGATSWPWKETWLFNACGKRLAVPINFTPDASGTKITVDAGAIKESAGQ